MQICVSIPRMDTSRHNDFDYPIVLIRCQKDAIHTSSGADAFMNHLGLTTEGEPLPES